MEMEGKLKIKVEELKALSAKKIEMELRVRFLKTLIEAKIESLEAEVLVNKNECDLVNDMARLVALVKKGKLEAEVLEKKRECDLGKEKEEISITTPAGPAAVIGNFGNNANYVHMGEGEGDWESDWDWSQA
ncbi:hypothetical protein PVAP13_8NG307734 [Panicum virgatum]|uniref:Uncharacterized protein n=1 Tax=Panicum virgatum TaxID=38727 RepID=A0A8T0PEE0_PANVG|nr:hypothetical protein PVAP13_8NG307734 [Panicum virgatum]